MTRSRIAILIGLAALGAGAAYAYDSYQDYRRAQAWEALLKDCDSCAARKQSAVRAKNLRDELAAEAAGEDAAGQ